MTTGVIATIVGLLLGLGFASLSLEAADWSAPGYANGSLVYLAILPLAWGAIGGLAFSPWLRFPPVHPSLADLAWNGGARGALAGMLAIVIFGLAWLLLGLGGPTRPGLAALGTSVWQGIGSLLGCALVGFVLGASYAVVAGRG